VNLHHRGSEDSLVEIATRRILAGAVWVGCVFMGQVQAQDARRLVAAVQLEPEIIPIGPDGGSPHGTGTAHPESLSEREFSIGKRLPEGPQQAAVPGAEIGSILGEEQPYADAVFGNCPPAGCERCAGGSSCPPKWYIESDVRALWRGRPRGVPAAIVNQAIFPNEVNPTFANPLIYLNSLEYGISPGLSCAIGRYLGTDMQGRDTFLEFDYWGLNSWNASQVDTGNRTSVTGVRVVTGGPQYVYSFGDLFSRFPSRTGSTSVAGFSRADQFTLRYDSDINDFELNLRFSPRSRADRMVLYPNGRWRRECQPGVFFSYLTGIRYIRIGDAATLRGDATFIREQILNDGTLGPAQRASVFGNYDVTTRNDLLGIQLGGEITYRDCRWTCDVHGKVAPMLDVARSRVAITSNGGFFPDNSFADPFANAAINKELGRNRDVCTLAGEFGFAATYRFTSRLMGRTSYDFLWIGGVALAPEQFDFSSANPTVPLITNGTAFYHGITAGLEYTW
jgi:hypothetical protein